MKTAVLIVQRFSYLHCVYTLLVIMKGFVSVCGYLSIETPRLRASSYEHLWTRLAKLHVKCFLYWKKVENYACCVHILG